MEIQMSYPPRPQPPAKGRIETAAEAAARYERWSAGNDLYKKAIEKRAKEAAEFKKLSSLRVRIQKAFLHLRSGFSKPTQYVPVTTRGVTPIRDGKIGLSFDVVSGRADDAIRVLISIEDFEWYADTVCATQEGRYLIGDQSIGSSDMPSKPKSVPSGGVNVLPPAASSTASRIDE
jgi:hypothetical protein